MKININKSQIIEEISSAEIAGHLGRAKGTTQKLVKDTKNRYHALKRLANIKKNQAINAFKNADAKANPSVKVVDAKQRAAYGKTADNVDNDDIVSRANRYRAPAGSTYRSVAKDFEDLIK